VSGTQSVEIYSLIGSLADTRKPLRSARAVWFNIDNIHWSGDRLVTAGVIQDEPACGGTRKEIIERGGGLECHRGWVAAQLDPVSLHWTVLSYGEAIPDFGGESTAQLIGHGLWLSSNNTNRVAWRPLSSLK
jgi:hypothetical protein